MDFCLRYSLLFWLLISCAQPDQRAQSAKESLVAYASTSQSNTHYLSCNQFTDTTFMGYVYKDSENPDPRCVLMDIAKSPKSFLKNEDLFLQVYPFTLRGDKMRYGSSLPIKTIEKFSKEALIQSQIIDAYLVEVEIKREPDYFFLDHLFEVCLITEESWEGLQLVLYERRAEQDPVPLRVTKFLLPPFLIHPEHFKEEKGNALAAFHPFLESIPQSKTSSKFYHDLAKEMCLPVL